MIRHTVLFELRSSATELNVKNAFDLLSQLQETLPGFIRLAYGECKFHGGPPTGKKIYGFSIDFANEEAYELFLQSPLANPAKESLLQIIEGGMDGIYGFDMGKSLNFAPTSDFGPADRLRNFRPRLVPRGF